MHRWIRSAPGRVLALVAALPTAWLGCDVSPSLAPSPGVLEYQRSGFVSVPGGSVNGAGGNLIVERLDLSTDTPLGTQQLGAVYNAASGAWRWGFEQRYDGSLFIDSSGAEHDVSAPTLPSGVYTLRVEGLDMTNLAHFVLPGPALCEDEAGEPCAPLRPFLLGDRVFLDCDGDGVQGTDEIGIPDVDLRLVGIDGGELTTTTSAAEGLYSFEANAGSYSVEVAAANFEAGAPLAQTAAWSDAAAAAATVARGSAPRGAAGPRRSQPPRLRRRDSSSARPSQSTGGRRPPIPLVPDTSRVSESGSRLSSAL